MRPNLIRRLPVAVSAGLIAGLIALTARAAEPAGASRELTAPGPLGQLAGTLLLPAPPSDDPARSRPTVLLLPGSGPSDRDGNSTDGVTAGATRLLAEGLAARGIASLRTDKRGLFGSARAVADPDAVSLGDYADDVERWLDALGAVPELSGDVWLAGHGEGSLIVLAAAARDLPTVRGLVLIAGPGRPLGVVLREQLADDPANARVLAEAFAAIEAIERGENVDADALPPGLRPIFEASTQGYLRELFAFDPAAALRALGQGDAPVPVMIVHGARDIQVSDEDARRLAAARPDARLLIVADMNHVLGTVTSDDRAANVAAYADPKAPIAPGVVDAIADFVTDTR